MASTEAAGAPTPAGGDAPGDRFARILVPLDGNRFSELAAPVAARLAERSGAALRFVMVHEPELPALIGPDGAFMATANDWRERREASARYLAAVAERISGVVSGGVESEVIDGLAGPALTGRIAEWRPDLVVMATHGRGPLTRFWLGSVADYLIRHVSVPLLLLKPRDDADWPPTEIPIRSILLPWDLSPAGMAIFGPAGTLANLHGARIDLAHVLTPTFTPIPAEFAYPRAADPKADEVARQAAEPELDRAATRLSRERGVEVRARIVPGQSAAATILDLLEREGHDVVALATHGRSGIRRALVGSVADKVIRGSERPVLVVRPSDGGG